MNISDPIADMLTRIRNAQARGIRLVTIPFSGLKMRILEILAKEGFVGPFRTLTINKKGVGRMPVIQLLLLYKGNQGIIKKLVRVSTPGKRVYLPAKAIKNPLSGLGLSIISTSKGLMSDREARKRVIGGEVLFHI